MKKTDVAIVGGGPAGLAVSIHAARHGLATLLLERQEFPRDKACGEGLMPAGLRELEALGARAYLTSADCAPIVGIRYLQGRLPAPGGLGIRRLALETALERAARTVGVELRENARVTHVERTSEHVRLTLATGEQVEARLLVAADGLASPLRRAQGLDVEPRASAPRRYGLRQHFQVRPWTPFVEVHFARGVEAYVTPAGDGRVGVAFLWEDGALEGRVGFSELLSHFPALGARLEGVVPDSSPRGAGPLERSARARSLDRFVLVGDAAGYVDAITGEGLTLAFRCAAELGRRLPEVLARGASRASLAGYERAIRAPYRRYVFFTRSLLFLARRPRWRAWVIRRLARVPRLFEWALNQVIEP
jgi:menaquinone-9 beta-reductase